MNKIWTLLLVFSLAMPASMMMTGCSDDDPQTETPDGGDEGDGGEEPETPALETIDFETLEVKTDYQQDAYAFSPLDIATIILCGEGYGEELIYGYYKVPGKGKFIRIDLNIPKDSGKLIPEGTYKLVDNSKLENTEYKPMTIFPYDILDGVWESGVFYRDTDADKYTFSGDETVSTVTITASTTVQDGYKVEVDLKDDKTNVKAVYEGVIKF